MRDYNSSDEESTSNKLKEYNVKSSYEIFKKDERYKELRKNINDDLDIQLSFLCHFIGLALLFDREVNKLYYELKSNVNTVVTSPDFILDHPIKLFAYLRLRTKWIDRKADEINNGPAKDNISRQADRTKNLKVETLIPKFPNGRLVLVNESIQKGYDDNSKGKLGREQEELHIGSYSKIKKKIFKYLHEDIALEKKFAELVRCYINGDIVQKESLKDFKLEDKNELNDFLASFSYLWLCIEPLRNPSTLILNQMLLDLVLGGKSRWEDIIKLMPTYKKGSVSVVRSLNNQYKDYMPFKTSYTYGVNKKNDKKTAELITKEANVIKKWLKLKKYENFDIDEIYALVKKDFKNIWFKKWKEPCSVTSEADIKIWVESLRSIFTLIFNNKIECTLEQKENAIILNFSPNIFTDTNDILNGYALKLKMVLSHLAFVEVRIKEYQISITGNDKFLPINRIKALLEKALDVYKPYIKSQKHRRKGGSGKVIFCLPPEGEMSVDRESDYGTFMSFCTNEVCNGIENKNFALLLRMDCVLQYEVIDKPFILSSFEQETSKGEFNKLILYNCNLKDDYLTRILEIVEKKEIYLLDIGANKNLTAKGMKILFDQLVQLKNIIILRVDIQLKLTDEANNSLCDFIRFSKSIRTINIYGFKFNQGQLKSFIEALQYNKNIIDLKIDIDSKNAKFQQKIIEMVDANLNGTKPIELMESDSQSYSNAALISQHSLFISAPESKSRMSKHEISNLNFVDSFSEESSFDFSNEKEMNPIAKKTKYT